MKLWERGMCTSRCSAPDGMKDHCGKRDSIHSSLWHRVQTQIIQPHTFQSSLLHSETKVSCGFNLLNLCVPLCTTIDYFPYVVLIYVDNAINFSIAESKNNGLKSVVTVVKVMENAGPYRTYRKNN